LTGEFHGSGCTLASAIAGQLASGVALADALQQAQSYTQHSLQHAFSIAVGQLIPARQPLLNTRKKS
jgi:hydroxymethylpyrimidine/phosphomethylpyrimidine kinase